MTKSEQSLLLYLESRAVDDRGLVASAHMNAEDFAKAKEWSESGYVHFGRILSSELEGVNSRPAGVGSIKAVTHWVRLSDQAWADAHRLRRERAERMMHRLAKTDGGRIEEQEEAKAG